MNAAIAYPYPNAPGWRMGVRISGISARAKDRQARRGVYNRISRIDADRGMHVGSEGEDEAATYSADDINAYLARAQAFASDARDAGRTAAAYADAAKKVLSGPATTDANAMRAKWSDVAKANDADYDKRAAEAREQFIKDMGAGTSAIALCPPCWVAMPAVLAVGSVAVAAMQGITALYKLGAHDYNSKEAQDKVQSLVSELNQMGVPIPAFSATFWFGAEDYGAALQRTRDRWASSAGLLFGSSVNHALRDVARFSVQLPTGEATAYAQAMVTKGFGGPLAAIEDLRASSEKYPWVFGLWLGRVFGSAYGVNPADVTASALLAAADWQKRNQAQYDAAPADSSGHATVDYWPAEQRDQTMAVAAMKFAIAHKTKEPPAPSDPPKPSDVGLEYPFDNLPLTVWQKLARWVRARAERVIP